MSAYRGDRANGFGAPALIEYNTNTSPRTLERGRRTSELGIRMALGASRASLIWLILQNALRLLAFGLLAGVAAAIAASHLIAAMLFGLTATDPSTIFIAAAVVLAAGLLAAYPPARHASRIDPMSSV
jgi:ABC-type antimicrobial peptide transport system permease subunit